MNKDTPAAEAETTSPPSPPEMKPWHKDRDLLTKLCIALVTIAFGFLTKQYLERKQDREMGVRLYTQLVSQRDVADNALRKDMFTAILQTFLEGGSGKIETKILSLELLTSNFHESLNLQPLFIYLRRELEHLSPDENMSTNKVAWLEERLMFAARETVRVQRSIIQEAKNTCELVFVKPAGINTNLREIVELSVADGARSCITKEVSLDVMSADLERKEVHVRLTIRDPGIAAPEVETSDFWVGPFDFPMINHTRLENDLRCAVMLTNFDRIPGIDDRGECYVITIALALFPGSRASLKERPYYQEIIEDLLPQ